MTHIIFNIIVIFQVRARERHHPVPSDWGQNGHCVPPTQARPEREHPCRIFPCVPGHTGTARELQGGEGQWGAAELRQARPRRQVHLQVPGVQPQPVGPRVLQRQRLLHHL